MSAYVSGGAFSTFITRPFNEGTSGLYYFVQYSLSFVGLLAGPFITLFLFWIFLHPKCKNFSTRVYYVAISYAFTQGIFNQILGYVGTDVIFIMIR